MSGDSRRSGQDQSVSEDESKQATKTIPIYAKVQKSPRPDKLSVSDEGKVSAQKSSSSDGLLSVENDYSDPDSDSTKAAPSLPPRLYLTEDDESGDVHVGRDQEGASLTDSNLLSTLQGKDGSKETVVEEDPYSIIPEDPYSIIPENREDLTEPKIDTSEHNDPPYSTINECQLNTKAFPVSGSDPDYDTVDESGWTAQSSNISNEHLDLEEDGYQRLPGDEDPIYDTVFDEEVDELFKPSKPARSRSLDTGMDQFKDEAIDEDPYSLPDLPPELPPRPAHLTRSVSEGQIDQLGVQRKKPRKLPLAGIVNWARGAKDKHAVLTGIEKPEIRHQRAQDLMNRCTKPGDTVVLTFRGSRHSAMLVYDDILQKPVYLSFGAEESYKERGGGINELAYDIYAFEDMLAEKNIVKLEGMDNKAILKKWRESIKGKTFNVLTRNCSAIIKKMILTGSEQILGKTKLEHDRHWQMPSNTLNLALEIKSKLGASPAK
ncbi:hypothetical protein [Endozoicomonas sp.]|uniref:hypothetical protein n=1 Tax=Endozoicomonas sp. TaxID=1892382 RepID=UPI003AF4FD00